jgi:hypothetical protein
MYPFERTIFISLLNKTREAKKWIMIIQIVIYQKV